MEKKKAEPIDMGKAHIVYSPTNEEVGLIGERKNTYFWEVWRGLPDVKFEPTKDRSGNDTLCYREAGNYIYVPNPAIRAYQRDKRTLFSAMMTVKARNGQKTHAVWLRPVELETIPSRTEDMAVRHAIELNQDKRYAKVPA